MGDEPIDECEYIFSHQHAMRRLISLLRSSQAYCTDNECLQDGNLPGTGDRNAENATLTFTLFLLAMFFAAMMYLLRPNSLRGTEPGSRKQPGNGNDDNDQPPPAPVQ